MRDFAQPKVMVSAASAAALTALACYPQLALWPARPQMLWILEAILFPCAFVLWGLVFAWHTRYSGRPIFPAKISYRLLTGAVMGGLVVGAILHFCFDPMLRQKLPGEYPVNILQWEAMTLFTLGFQQLFLLFAPFAFFARLFRSDRAAIHLTVFFGVVMVLLKMNSAAALLPPWLSVGLVITRVLTGFLALYFYLRGGIFLIFCWSLMIQLRHLLDLIH